MNVDRLELAAANWLCSHRLGEKQSAAYKLVRRRLCELYERRTGHPIPPARNGSH